MMTYEGWESFTAIRKRDVASHGERSPEISHSTARFFMDEFTSRGSSLLFDLVENGMADLILIGIVWC